jgi:carboxylesterase type B
MFQGLFITMNATYSTVVIPEGEVIGVTSKHCESFYGIPYALPPNTASRRFQKPVPVTEKFGTLQANKIPPICMQLTKSGKVTGSEDCLYLNVYRPVKTEEDVTKEKNDEEANLPVFVFIHGGAFRVGDGYWGLPSARKWRVDLYNGKKFAVKNKCIVVTMNYRLGILGFMTYETGTSQELVTNLALLDQREALLWVKKNIKFFGGNEENITLAGQSAGAFSVIFHIFSPGSADLVKKYIVSSGTVDIEWFFQPRNQALELYNAYSVYLGCPPKSHDQLQCLLMIHPDAMILSWKEFTIRNCSYRKQYSPFSFNRAAKFPPGWIPHQLPPFVAYAAHGVVIDETEEGLPKTPLAMVETMDFSGKSFMVGVTSDEGSMFVNELYKVLPHIQKSDKTSLTIDDILETITWTFPGENQNTQIPTLYNFAYPQSPPHAILSKILTDAVFTCPTKKLMSKISAQGGTVYGYVFDVPLKFFGTASHGVDLPFLFRHSKALLYSDFFDMKNRGKILAAAKSYSGSVGRFVHKGDPGWCIWSQDEQCYRKITVSGPVDEFGETWNQANCENLWDHVDLEWVKVQ